MLSPERKETGGREVATDEYVRKLEGRNSNNVCESSVI